MRQLQGHVVPAGLQQALGVELFFLGDLFDDRNNIAWQQAIGLSEVRVVQVSCRGLDIGVDTALPQVRALFEIGVGELYLHKPLVADIPLAGEVVLSAEQMTGQVFARQAGFQHRVLQQVLREKRLRTSKN